MMFYVPLELFFAQYAPACVYMRVILSFDSTLSKNATKKHKEKYSLLIFNKATIKAENPQTIFYGHSNLNEFIYMKKKADRIVASRYLNDRNIRIEE